MANKEKITFTELNEHKILEDSNVIYKLDIGGPLENHYIVIPKESNFATGNLCVMKERDTLHLKSVQTTGTQTSFQFDGDGVTHCKCCAIM